MTLTVGSLFSGIGGLDLGLERAGMKVIWQSEIDPYACKVLKKHWPEVPNHGDIKQINWRAVEPVDVICGGYPCQPFSTAGKRKGTDDPRHLWPWVRTAISELRPRYAILENVRGHLSLGGLQVIGELAEIGYDAEWRVVSAAGLGAPHRRDRIIIVAYPTELLSNGSNNNARVGMESQTISQFGDSSRSENVANADGGRQQKRNKDERSISVVDQKSNGKSMADTDGKQLGQRRITQDVGSQNQIWGYNGRRKTSYDGWQWWEVEPDVGRVADGISNRVDRLRGLGNAVVPQVAEYIGRLITTSLDA
jgi:DNA (cytosine-5)-methyltransferase 1